ncbi:MAG: hypothetical protein M0R28_17650 [Pigmentiphaga sp.]|nr:hypothetical protein [Pigmentiphaga sp.]
MTTTATATTHFAAIATDGISPVVWGVGATEAEAREDASDLSDGEVPTDYVIVPITAAQLEQIEAGEVSLEALGIELTEAQIAALS